MSKESISMRNWRNRLGFVIALVTLMALAVMPTVAQDTTGNNDKFKGFSRVQLSQAELSCYLGEIIQNRPGEQTLVGVKQTIPVEGGEEFDCVDIVAYVKTLNFDTLVDYSWMSQKPAFFALGAAANVRVAPDANARQLPVGLTPSSDPVIEVDAVLKISDTETRLLVRAAKVSGWINNGDAKVDLTKPVDKPVDWDKNFAIDPDTLNNVAGGEPTDWGYTTLFAPNGWPLTDVTRTKTDLFGHGTLFADTDIHFVFGIRENGRYNPNVVFNGFWERQQGDLWRYFSGWNVGGDVAKHENMKECSIACQFMIKDADEHRRKQFEPTAYVYLPYNIDPATWQAYHQNDIFSWAATPEVLQKAVCPSEPVLLNVAGAYAGNTVDYTGAVGNHMCPSFMLGVAPDTAADTLVLTVLDPDYQAQNVPYLRDNTVFVMGNPKTTADQWKKWLKDNFNAFATTKGWADRTQVNVTSFPGLTDGTHPIADVIGAVG